MIIVTVGIDPAKNVFAIYGVDAIDKPCWFDPVWHRPNCWNSSHHFQPASSAWKRVSVAEQFDVALQGVNAFERLLHADPQIGRI